MHLTRTLLLILLSLAVAGPVSADPLTPAKSAGIRYLMQLTGTDNMEPELSGQLKSRARQALKADGDKISERVEAIVDFEVRQLLAERRDLLEDKLMHIYADHFSHDEIKQLISFYRSDIGKKSLRVLPAIRTESRETGRQWGETLVTELVRRINARMSAGDLRLTE
ncbi:DUF2059 domain-containing protein [Geothermobacter hydrogeniphilus]|nr:DUF2059 domain-containing protein [Geothermobacter hydrogeniphilus]